MYNILYSFNAPRWTFPFIFVPHVSKTDITDDICLSYLDCNQIKSNKLLGIKSESGNSYWYTTLIQYNGNSENTTPLSSQVYLVSFTTWTKL